MILIGAVVIIRAAVRKSRPAGPPCQASAGTTPNGLQQDQATNATTIAAVGKRLGLPDHAVTIALAAALQESDLHNLTHGDRDSLGLFQQRPSQGWGTPSQILTPRLAAAAFYNRLSQVDGWQGLSVTDAAQRVQQSAAPSAYAQWESEARVLAEVLTGEVAAGFTCRFRSAHGGALAGPLSQAMSQELGVSNLSTPFPPPFGWTTATWLVAHAQQYRLTAVTYAGERWTAATGAWKPDPAADTHVRVVPPVAGSAP